MNTSKVLLFLIAIFTLLIFINSSLSAEITEPIRDGDYIYIDDSKAYLKGTYSVTHGEDIEHWAMTKSYSGDCDMAIGFNGEVAWPTKVLLEDQHYVFWDTNTSKTFYYVTNFDTTTDAQDYGNWYNLLKYKFNHKIHIGYDNTTNESIWQDAIGTVAYFDSQENDGTNYTITWHTEHSRLEQYRDISNRILANPINYEFDGKDLWFVTKDIPMTANEMRKIVIEMDGKMEWGVGNSYKYDIIWKPSHQTIAEARALGNLMVLDPLWNSSYDIRLKMPINNTAGAGAQTYFQLNTNISTYDVNASSMRCYNRTSGVIIPHWNESVNDGNVYELWTNNTAIADGWDNNYFCAWESVPTTNSLSSGGATFMFFDDAEIDSAGTNMADSSYNPWYKTGSGTFQYTTGSKKSGNQGMYLYGNTDGSIILDNDTVNPWIGYGDYIIEVWWKPTTGNDFTGVNIGSATLISGYHGYTGGATQFQYRNNVPAWVAAGAYSNQWYKLKVVCKHDAPQDTNIYIDGSEITVGLTADCTGAFHKWRAYGGSGGRSCYLDNYIIYEYNATPPVYENIELEHYSNSLHYNITQEVNNTIYSNPVEMALNRSAVTSDDINDTAGSTGISYIQVTNKDNGANIVRNFTITGDDLDWYQAENITGSYNMKNSSGTIQTVADGNFTTNLVAGDYWIESEGIVITRTSQTPTYLYENTTGTFQVIWDVEHSAVGLNHSRIYHMWNQYDYGIDCYCNSIRFPSNNKASNFTPTGEYILRQDNRNSTALFENDTRVTEGNIGKWGGLDKNSARMNIVEINSTNTRIYINGTAQDMVFPNSWPLNRIELEDATKTAYSIYINNPIIIKWYDIEAAKGNTNYIVSPYFDTELNGLTPTFPIEIYYHNGSFNPLGAVDIEDSPDLVYVTSITGTDWINWTYSPRANADYINGVYLNSSSIVNAGVTPDKDSFWYLKSQTSPSRAYDIMLANSATSTNKSFAQTDSVWIGNTAPYTAHLYTASLFTSFSRGEHQINYRLFVTDNNSVNATSVNYTSNISASIFPPSTPTINHFHFLGETDYDMDGVYYGNFSIGCGVSSDPDGGDVTHNLTLHYANNLTVVTIINNTFTDKNITHNGVYFDANFSSIPYYSQTENYTLRLIATDDESETVTVWLGVNFSLDGSPRIISYSPDTPVSSTEGENQTFSITTNLLGNVTWYLDSVEVFNETDVNSSSYSNSTALAGVYNVTVVTTNTNGSNSMTWDWTVKPSNPLLFKFYVILVVFALLMTGYTFLVNDINNYTNIITGYLSGILYFIAGYYAYIGIGIDKVHETATFSGGVITSTVSTVTVTAYQYDWLGLLFIVIGVIMILYSVVQSIGAVQYIIAAVESSKS